MSAPVRSSRSIPDPVSILKIVHYPEAVLLRPAVEVEQIDGTLRALVSDMVETMHAAPGVGLAANQVGVGRRVAVIDLTVGEDPSQLRVLINPRIAAARGRQAEEEGCLSVPGLNELVARPAWVRVEATDLEGRRCEIVGEGLMARALCHELDHLDGRLFLHRLSNFKRERLKRRIQKAISEGVWD